MPFLRIVRLSLHRLITMKPAPVASHRRTAFLSVFRDYIDDIMRFFY